MKQPPSRVFRVPVAEGKRALNGFIPAIKCFTWKWHITNIHSSLANTSHMVPWVGWRVRAVILNQGRFCTSRGHLAMSGGFQLSLTWDRWGRGGRVILASSGWRTGMLLTSYNEQDNYNKKNLVQNVYSDEFKEPWLRGRHIISNF